MTQIFHSLNWWQFAGLAIFALCICTAVFLAIGCALGWLWRWWFVNGRDTIEDLLDAGFEAVGLINGDYVPAVKDAPAIFCGWQDPMGTALPPIELWNLVEDIPGHSRNSTVSRQTLERAGFRVPPPPAPCPEFAQ